MDFTSCKKPKGFNGFAQDCKYAPSKIEIVAQRKDSICQVNYFPAAFHFDRPALNIREQVGIIAQLKKALYRIPIIF